MEKKLIQIGCISDLNLRVRAKHFGAYVITNYETGVHEVYAWEDKAEYIKSRMFDFFNLIEKGGRYYVITYKAQVEITLTEFNYLKLKSN